ncbi:hypothetical protein JW865_07530 [Candidatus Bathyarchaeota archaeon]|nr:hypothetical protein [Candidatus Bathyarchaeota archaeon]
MDSNNFDPDNLFGFLEIIGGHFSEDGDVIVGILDLAPNVEAAIVQVYPAGTIKKKSEGQKLNLNPSEIKTAIVEISSTAREDYQKNVVFSRMSDIRNPVFLDVLKPRSHESSNVPCTLAIISLPPISINIRDKNVFEYIKEKFLKLSVTSLERVLIDVAGYSLPFAISYAYPKERVLISKETFISFLIPVGMVDDKVGFDFYPQIPDELMLLFPNQPSLKKQSS